MPADRDDRRATVGVICCARQAEDTIDQMLASLAGQTRLPDQVVVVDDASTDRTGERARMWEGRLPITVVRAEENLGPGAARHVAVEHLTTDLIAPVDADDVALPDHLAALSAHLSPGRCAVGTAGFYWFPGQPLTNFYDRSRLRLESDRQLHQLLVANRLLIAGLYRRVDYDAVGGFEDMAHEDWGLWVKLAVAGVSISICPVPTYLYRQHPASLTGDDGRRSALDTSAFEQLIALAKDHLPAEEIDQIRVERAQFVARLDVQEKLTVGDVAGAQAIARSVPADGDRTLWAVSHLPVSMIRVARSIENVVRKHVVWKHGASLMRILYNLPHLNDWLDDERAGHLVRANEMLAGFEANGCTVVHAKPRRRPGSASMQIAPRAPTGVAVADAGSDDAGNDRSLRAMVHRHLPRRLALIVRDSARYAHHLLRCRSLMATVRRERPDAIFETYEVSSFASAVVARRTGVPLVIDDLCPLEEHWALYGTGSKWVSHRLRRFVLDNATLLVAVNAANAAALRRDGVPDDKIVEVPNGVRADALGVADAAAIERARAIRDGLDVGVATLALYVGSFQPFHRVDVLIDALADRALRDVPLVAVLVGDGDGIDEIRRRARERGVGDRVRWVGRVAHEHVASYVAAADLGVVAGATENVNPMKIYEYLAGGLPVVAPDIAMVTALLVPGDRPEHRAGVVFRRDDPHAMAEALAALANDGVLRGELAAAARASTPVTWPERARTLEERIRALSVVVAGDPVPSSGRRP